MNTNFDLTFGTDPEFFVCEFIGGKEYSVPVPHFIENLGIPEIGFDETRKHPKIYSCEEFNVLMDGVAFECNYKPSKTPAEMHRKVKNSLEVIGGIAEKFGYHVSVKPTVFYDFFKWYRKDSKALEWCGIFGCDPDRDAILEQYNSPEIDVTKHPYRYGGGHLHISDNNVLIKDFPVPFIRLLALTVGNASVAFSPYPEEEKLRMFKYGMPGRFRVQNYPDGNTGVEYRSPSNVWTSELELTEIIFHYAKKAYELLNDPDLAIKKLDEFLMPSVTAITTVDKALALDILSKI